MSDMRNGTGVDSKRVKLSSYFAQLEVCPPDVIFNVKNKFVADKSPDKVNLSIGGKVNLTLRDEIGQTLAMW